MTEEEYRKKKLQLYRNIVNDQSFSEENATNNLLCKRCEGECCKSFPCAFSPDDFIDVDDFDYMKTILDTGFFVIDRYPHNSNMIYYIRGRGMNDTNGIIVKNGSKYNECMLLTENGCLFDFYTRPTFGALVEPNRDGIFITCFPRYSLKQISEDWLKHQKNLLRLKRYYTFRKKSPNVSKIYKLERIIRQDEI